SLTKGKGMLLSVVNIGRTSYLRGRSLLRLCKLQFLIRQKPPSNRVIPNMAPMRWLPSRTQSHQLIVSAYVGSIIAIFTIIACLSLGTLIFSASLSFAVAQGIGMALISAVLAGSIVAWRSSYPATIAIPQDRTAPILALMAANIAAHLPISASPEARCLTI